MAQRGRPLRAAGGLRDHKEASLCCPQRLVDGKRAWREAESVTEDFMSQVLRLDFVPEAMGSREGF